MTIGQLRYPKKSGTYADTLVAVGLASLVEELGEGKVTSRILDLGDHFRVNIHPPLALDNLSAFSPGYPYIRDKKDTQIPSGEVIDYEAEKAVEERWRKWRKTTDSRTRREVAISGERIGLGEPSPPHPDIRFLKILASLRKGFSGDKELWRFINDGGNTLNQAVLDRLLSYAGQPANDRGSAELSLGISSSQIFNPTSGKGVHRTKPSGSGASQYPKQLVDWFEEWMKFRAAFKFAMLGYRSGEDFRIFVLQPSDASPALLMALRAGLRDAQLWGAVRLDILASLHLGRLLLEYSREYGQGQRVFSFGGKRPNEIIAGIHLAYFKSLGTAAALMNASFIGIPGWFPIQSEQNALNMLEIIDEHRTCVRFLQEDRSDEMPILLAYRRFISSGNIVVFLEFLSLFAPYVMSKAANRQRVKRFSTDLLRRLFVAYKLEEIVDNPGFQNIARAVRKATIVAQYRAANNDRQWDIHYGLAQRWKRKVKFKDQFIQEVSDFVASFNYENARHAEQEKERRANVTTEDLEQFIELIDRYGSELVGMLLIGYGYAREPREEKGGIDLVSADNVVNGEE